MTSYTITPEELEKVCIEVSDVMKGETSVQNCTFPTAEIIAGVADGLSPAEIAAYAYSSIINNPLNTCYAMVQTGNTLHNMAQFMSGKALELLNKYVTVVNP